MPYRPEGWDKIHQRLVQEALMRPTRRWDVGKTVNDTCDALIEELRRMGQPAQFVCKGKGDFDWERELKDKHGDLVFIPKE